MSDAQIGWAAIAVILAVGYGGKLWFRIAFPEVYRDMQDEKRARRKQWTDAASHASTPIVAKIVEQMFRR